MTPNNHPSTDPDEHKREIEKLVDDRIKRSYYISEFITYFPLVLFLIIIGLANQLSNTKVILLGVIGTLATTLFVCHRVNAAFKKATQLLDNPNNK